MGPGFKWSGTICIEQRERALDFQIAFRRTFRVMPVRFRDAEAEAAA